MGFSSADSCTGWSHSSDGWIYAHDFSLTYLMCELAQVLIVAVVHRLLCYAPHNKLFWSCQISVGFYSSFSSVLKENIFSTSNLHVYHATLTVQ